VGGAPTHHTFCSKRAQQMRNALVNGGARVCRRRRLELAEPATHKARSVVERLATQMLGLAQPCCCCVS
jgi:hypothetical protein